MNFTRLHGEKKDVSQWENQKLIKFEISNGIHSNEF